MRALCRVGPWLLALASAPVALASCGDDDDDRAPTAGAAGASAGSAGITANGSGGVAGVITAGRAGALSGAGGASGAAGAGGASTSFRCGLSASLCDATKQYCLAVFSELTEPSARCVDVPPECAAAPDCACLNAHAAVEEAACTATMTTCTSTAAGAAGAFTVACRGTP